MTISVFNTIPVGTTSKVNVCVSGVSGEEKETGSEKIFLKK